MSFTINNISEFTNYWRQAYPTICQNMDDETAGASTLPMLIAPYTKDWQKSGTNPFEIGKLSKKGVYRDIDRARGKAKRDWRGYV